MIIWTRSVEMNRKVSIMARDKAGKGSIAHEAGGSKAAGEGRAGKGAKHKTVMTEPRKVRTDRLTQ